MMEIPEIKIKGGEIDTVRIPYTPDYLAQPPQTIRIGTPVTSQIGVPIVDVPGCVEAHQVDENNMLEGDDPKGVRVYCDGQQPSFNPIDYNKEDLQFTGEAEVPAIPPPKDLEVDAPEIPKKTVTKEIKCPTEAQQLKQPIGTLVKDGKEKIIEYRLVGKECIAISEEISFADQVVKGIPSANQVAQTGGIAIVATAAATATPILLKAIKPIVKQAVKKIQKLFGKEPPKLSASDIRADKYREKKGLPPIKRSKKK
jgi:hypothetical protein